MLFGESIQISQTGVYGAIFDVNSLSKSHCLSRSNQNILIINCASFPFVLTCLFFFFYLGKQDPALSDFSLPAGLCFSDPLDGGGKLRWELFRAY